MHIAAVAVAVVQDDDGAAVVVDDQPRPIANRYNFESRRANHSVNTMDIDSLHSSSFHHHWDDDGDVVTLNKDGNHQHQEAGTAADAAAAGIPDDEEDGIDNASFGEDAVVVAAAVVDLSFPSRQSQRMESYRQRRRPGLLLLPIGWQSFASDPASQQTGRSNEIEIQTCDSVDY